MSTGRRTKESASRIGGRKREFALTAAQARLENDHLNGSTFTEVAQTVLVHGWKKNTRTAYAWDANKWLPLLETAYDRMDESSRNESGALMVWAFWNAGLHEQAAKYHDRTPLASYTAYDLAISVDLLRKLKREEELATRLKVARAILGKGRLGMKKLSKSERSYLAAAIVRACWQRGDITACKEYIPQIRNIDVHWDAALLLPIQISLAQVRQQIWKARHRMDAYEKSIGPALERVPAGYRKQQLQTARRTLQRISQMIGRVFQA